MVQLTLQQPLPAKGAVRALRQQIVDALVEQQPEVGAPLPSYDELVEQASVSRSTVRRALQSLSREGWLEQKQGQGTFVGPRVALHSESGNLPAVPLGRIKPQVSSKEDAQLLRLSVLVMNLGHLDNDPCTPPMLRGIDEAALANNLSVEVLGGKTDDPESIVKRLHQTQPDVLAVFPHTPRHLFIVGEAQRLGIKVICVAYLPELGVPCVHEDSIEAGALCVQHLAEHGHEKISAIYAEGINWWSQHRRRGVEQGLIGCACDPQHITRLSLWPEQWEHDAQRIEAHLRQHEPTAVICTAASQVASVQAACDRLGLSVPNDLSVITIDQVPQSRLIQGVPIAHVQMPYAEMGKTVARVARQWARVNNIAMSDLPDPIPCLPITGKSVRSV